MSLDTLHLGLMPALYRVPFFGMPANLTNQIKLYTPQNATQDLQVIVHNAGVSPVTINAVSCSALTNSQGDMITSDAITYYREKYIVVQASSLSWGTPNEPQGPGMYADGLIPFQQTITDPIKQIQALPHNLAAFTNQPFWLDIKIDHNTPAGTYQGVIIVTTNQGSLTAQVELVVWNFALPHSPTLRTSFGINYCGSKPDTWAELLLEHRMMPQDYPANTDLLAYDQQFGLNTLNSGLWSRPRCASGKSGSSESLFAYPSPCNDGEYPILDPAPSTNDWQSLEQSYPLALQPLLYNYTVDEITEVVPHAPDVVEAVAAWSANIHQGSSIKQMITTAPSEHLMDDGTGRPIVDIWGIVPVHVLGRVRVTDDNYTGPNFLGNILDAQNRGGEIWTYTALVQENYSPKWLIDFTPIQFSLFPWINTVYGFDGMLYWRVNAWTKPDGQPACGYTINDQIWFKTGADGRAGDGFLVYPGEQVGRAEEIIPSMRLKWMRDGIQDYDIIQLLIAKTGKTIAMDCVHQVTRGYKQWTSDPQKLYSARHRMGSLLDVISRTQMPDLNGRLMGSWRHLDISSTSPTPGNTHIIKDKITVATHGGMIDATQDDFHFVKQQLIGDGEIIAQVERLDNTHAEAKAGIMIREDLEQDSANVLVYYAPNQQAVMQARLAKAETTTRLATSSLQTLPTWLRLVRQADQVSTYFSEDGLVWQLLSTTLITLNHRVFVGLAVTANNALQQTLATFTGVRVISYQPTIVGG